LSAADGHTDLYTDGLPDQVTEMRSTVQAIWSIFDTDGSGSIERGEFLRPNEGLADTILATLGQA
jgi:hypothetical protein